MFNAEKTDRLMRQQQLTGHEWKRTIKRQAGNVNQFNQDIEKFTQTRHQNAFDKNVETFMEY